MPFLFFDAIQKILNCLLGLWFHISIHFLIAQLLLYTPLFLKEKVLHFRKQSLYVFRTNCTKKNHYSYLHYLLILKL